MKKISLLIFAAIVAVLSVIVFIRCNLLYNELPEQNQSDTKNLFQVPNAPQRIVSLAPNLTEILFALGLGEKIVAVSNDSDYPPAVANKKKTGSFWQPNTEAIVACKPDLVITLWFEQQKTIADSLKRLGYRVLSLKLETVEQLPAAIKKIGIATDFQQRADSLAKTISNQLDELQSRFNTANKVKVLWVVQPEPLRVVGRETYINRLIEIAGGQNAIGPTIQQYPPIGSEELLVSGAEVIIQSAMGKNNITEQQKAAEAFWSKWLSLPAVKNNRIYVIETDTVLRLGPRLPAGIELIAGYLHSNDTEKNSISERNRTLSQSRN